MTVIETERLLLKQANIDDGPFFFELLNTPGWLKFIGDRGVRSLHDARNYIQSSLIHSYEKNGFGLYKMVLKNGGEPIGLCGLLKRPTLENVDLGYAILPGYERNGYTYEAAKATLEYATTKLGLRTVLAITTKENISSKNLLQKIGLCFIDKIKLGDEELLLYSN